jgi:hypothetical protein
VCVCIKALTGGEVSRIRQAPQSWLEFEAKLETWSIIRGKNLSSLSTSSPLSQHNTQHNRAAQSSGVQNRGKQRGAEQRRAAGCRTEENRLDGMSSRLTGRCTPWCAARASLPRSSPRWDRRSRRWGRPCTWFPAGQDIPGRDISGEDRLDQITGGRTRGEETVKRREERREGESVCVRASSGSIGVELKIVTTPRSVRFVCFIISRDRHRGERWRKRERK